MAKRRKPRGREQVVLAGVEVLVRETILVSHSGLTMKRLPIRPNWPRNKKRPRRPGKRKKRKKG